MTDKILIPLFEDDIAPRFDLATEVLITKGRRMQPDAEEKIIVLPQASAEQLCHLILTEDIRVVICGGIEEEYYRYLTWKKVTVLDSIMGPWRQALDRFFLNRLAAGTNLYETEETLHESDHPLEKT